MTYMNNGTAIGCNHRADNPPYKIRNVVARLTLFLMAGAIICQTFLIFIKKKGTTFKGLNHQFKFKNFEILLLEKMQFILPKSDRG